MNLTPSVGDRRSIGRSIFIAAAIWLLLARTALALSTAQLVGFAPVGDGFALVHDGQAAPLWLDAADYPGVLRAAHDLQADIARVSNVKAALETAKITPGPMPVIVGTLGHSALVDGLARNGKIDTSKVAGQWESFLIAVVPQPMPGVAQALVVAGSDKRGTIYGIYELSEEIGVSPWYWWADVTPDHHDTLYVKPGVFVQGPPSVKYRGIFLNDEYPDLTRWVSEKFGTVKPGEHPPIPPGIANYGHEFYEKLFEVMLRLRANYLWPAMWNNAFNEDDPENPRLADEYGIVMGTSHQEPMMRAQKEWDRRYEHTIGHWNYEQNPKVLEDFWREGIHRNKHYENLVTMGLRGANDTPMAPGGPAANMALLEKIVGVQRGILRDEVNPDITKVPQLWCLYKEVQEFYEAGMRVPDDVTLLWAEDNWGNLRRVPTAEERTRSGGAGVYYHFDYHGGPRNYQWLNTSPIAKVWDQMSLAKRYGADRVWIVNVGHFKGYEFPLEYFLSLAWDTNRWTNTNLDDYTQRWAAREFGPAHAGEIATIVERYSKYNGRRKPEMLRPDTYSLTDYREAETVVADYEAISAQAEAIMKKLPPEKRAAFFELVLFPTQASANLNALYLAAGRNALYAKQGRASTNLMAGQTRALFERDAQMTDYFNHTLEGGKWDHFMDQTHIGYKIWRDPPHNSLDAIKLAALVVPEPAAMGVAVEGSTEAWPSPGASEAVLPQFDAFNRQRHYLEVFNRGRKPFDFTATASEHWIVLSADSGTVGPDLRIWVTIDWSRVPQGTASGSIQIAGAGGSVVVKVDAFNPAEPTRASLHGFVEGEGYVSMEAEHYTTKTDAGPNRWIRIEDYGRTLSGLRAEGPVDAPPAVPGKDSPCLAYDFTVFAPGQADVTAILAPTMNFLANRDLRCAISFDDEPPQTIVVVPHAYLSGNGNRNWEKVVGDNARLVHWKGELTRPGRHTLKFWMVDPGVVLTKLVVNLGGLKPSYLGPPESFRGPAK